MFIKPNADCGLTSVVNSTSFKNTWMSVLDTEKQHVTRPPHVVGESVEPDFSGEMLGTALGILEEGDKEGDPVGLKLGPKVGEEDVGEFDPHISV